MNSSRALSSLSHEKCFKNTDVLWHMPKYFAESLCLAWFSILGALQITIR